MTTGLPDAYPPRVQLAAGTTAIGKVSLITQAGLNATDETARGSRVLLVDAAGNAIVTGATPANTAPAGMLNILLGVQRASGAADALNSVAAANDGSSGNGTPLVALAANVGASYDKLRTPSVFKTATATVLNTTALWTPASGKKFRLMGGFLMLTGEAALAAPGDLEITLLDQAAAIGIGMSYYVPALAVNEAYAVVPFNLGNGKLSATANNILNINLGTALAAGEVRASVWGTEE